MKIIVLLGLYSILASLKGFHRAMTEHNILCHRTTYKMVKRLLAIVVCLSLSPLIAGKNLKVND